jgi:hypothetical protein
MRILEALKRVFRRECDEDEPAARPDQMTVDNVPFYAPTGYVKTYDADRPRH